MNRPSRFSGLATYEGILPALEPAHAVFAAMQRAREMGATKSSSFTISGRGDKDMPRWPTRWSEALAISRAFHRAGAESRAALIAYLMAGIRLRMDGIPPQRLRSRGRTIRARHPLLRPESPTFRDSGGRATALRAGTRPRDVVELAARIRQKTEIPLILMTS